MWAVKMCMYTLKRVMADKMRMSESSEKSVTWVNLSLDQYLQNKAFETVLIYCKMNVLLQFYSDVPLSEKRIDNLI